jgi:uncharacterized UBP type Zn finger protein
MIDLPQSLKTMFEESQTCSHIAPIQKLTKAKTYICEECVKTGSQWVHLRTCQSCGITLCCDNSPNKHATAHYHQSHHPVIISAEPHEKWIWCYPDELFIEYP